MKIRTTLTEQVRVPIIRVIDRASGDIHIVGTNCHDYLSINNGHIDYLNLQCCEGTQFIKCHENEGYEFIGEFNEIECEKYVGFVSLAEFVKIMKTKQKEINKYNKKLKKFIKRRKL